MIRIVDSNYIKSAVNPPDYPVSGWKEIAFCGRSNVGKSSMINTLTGRKLLAKISSTPGKTRLVNFFDIRCKAIVTDPSLTQPTEEMDCFFTLVDLPGYGYAQVSKTERASWKPMIEKYLTRREQLGGVVVLVDIRHKADPKDIMMLEMVRAINVPFVVVATKSDKIPVTKIPSHLKDLRIQMNLKNHQIRDFSSHTKKGLNELLKWIEDCIFLNHSTD